VEHGRFSLGHRLRPLVVGAVAVISAVLYFGTVTSLVQARANRYADTAALFQAFGGGWWNRSDVVSTAQPTVKAANNLESQRQN